MSFTRAGIVRGARDCVPVMIGSTPFGIVCGITANGAGLSPLEAGLMGPNRRNGLLVRTVRQIKNEGLSENLPAAVSVYFPIPTGFIA